jgi:hypothetical protein
MKFIGNYASWLDQEIIDAIIKGEGERRPVFNTENSDFKKQLSYLTDVGYDLNKVGWSFFYNQHINRDHIELPFSSNGKKYKWWFSKLNPGDIFPVHVDTPKDEKNIERYWMACQDHQIGHIFAHEHGIAHGYKAGDVFKFDAHEIMHAAANIGLTPKISFQFMFFD